MKCLYSITKRVALRFPASILQCQYKTLQLSLYIWDSQYYLYQISNCVNYFFTNRHMITRDYVTFFLLAKINIVMKP